MGLFDDPIGYVFGGDSDKGTVDKRSERTSEGKRWWEQWEEVFGSGGDLDPSNIMRQAYDALNRKVNINFGGQTLPTYPKSGQRQASSYLGLLQPWYDAGMELERGRYGGTYYDPGDDGLLGTLVNGIAEGIGKGVGTGVGYGTSRKLFG